jgi:radical SAM protein with 4Fe4S-binding SPASM domain
MLVNDKFPDIIRIETSGLCNFRCKYCVNWYTEHKRGNLSTTLFKTLLKQFEEEKYVPRVAVLHTGGEPFMNKNIFTYINDLRLLGIKKIKMNSNCSLMGKEESEKLIKSGLTDLYCSFDGRTEEENNNYRVGSNFQRDSENVLYLLSLIKKNNSNMHVTIWNTVLCSKDEVMDNKIPSLSAPAYLINRFKDYQNFVNIMSVPAQVWFGYDETKSPFEIVMEPEIETKQCNEVFDKINVLANGDVVPCCNDVQGKCVFENIKNKSIFEIWNSLPYVNFRESLREPIDLTKINKYCHGCEKITRGKYFVK